MALSQIQCLDDNNVNPRTHESKPEFFYSEDQRLALEALLRDGREEFMKFLEARGLRGFLSDPELETLSGAVEPYDPGLEVFQDEDDPTPLSLHYWPELSDTSIPQMDLGWPDSDAYRGVTRTTVYTQPPLEGQAHIKEVVRKMIAQAQKVIAVVMDIFTDVDIFRDLLDAGFKRRVSVYILLERTSLPHFLSMCQRANMHAGHLKHLRVRCTEGAEFYTRSSTKVRGRMGHRFMFMDGDKAVSGSYSFTWMSSRLDRNLITVITGQAVDGFDRLFRFLYMTSSSVDLRQVSMEPEPEPDPLPQPAAVVPQSAALARKLYNPKYALVAVSNASPTTSVGHDSAKEPQNPEDSKKKKKRKRAIEEATQDAPPLHPGLVNLEKACLITYLPTWPEPDPSSDVIGFINIRDSSRPTQVHLQRHEMFETSQAIRFSSPINKPKESLPEVAELRQLTPKHEETNKLQQAQNKTKAEELVVDRAQPAQLRVAPGDVKSKEEAPEQKSAAPGKKSEPDKDTKALNTDNKLCSNTVTKQGAGHSTPYLSALPPSSSPTPHNTTTTQTVSTSSPKLDSLPESNTKKTAAPGTSLNTQRSLVYRTHILESNSTETSQLPGPTDSNINAEQDTQRKSVLPHTDPHTEAVHKQPQISSQMTPNIQSPIVHNHISTSSAAARPSVRSTLLSENTPVAITTVHSNATTTVSSSSHLPLTSSTALNPPLPSSSSLTSAPPVPKPRTVQLFIKDTSTSNGQKLPEICVISRPLVVFNELAAVATAEETSPVKEPETVPELQDSGAGKTRAQKDTKNTGSPKETPQRKQSVTSQETKGKEADGRRNGGAGAQSITGNKLETQSDVVTAGAAKAAGGNIQGITPKDVDPKTDFKITPKTDTDCVATVQSDSKAPEETLTGRQFAEVPNEKDENVTESKTYLARAHTPQRISYSKLTPQDIDVLEAVDSIISPTHYTSYSLYISKDSAGDNKRTSAADTPGQQGKQSTLTPALCTDSTLNTAKLNTHNSVQEQIPKTRGSANTPEKVLRLHLSEKHVPDFRSPTPERESRLLAALARAPTPDGSRPESRTTTPDPRSYTPDLRTPTSDISDGYASAREGSILSTTSDEYYECSDSPVHEPVFDHMGYHNDETTEDHVGFTRTSSPNASTTGSSPAYINYSPGAATLTTAGRNTSCSETQTLSGPASVSSSSSLGKKVEMREVEDTANEEKGRTVTVAERRAERESQETERRHSEEAERIEDHFKQDEVSTETAEKGDETQAPKRKRVPNQSASDSLVDRGVASGQSANEETEPKRLSTGDLKPVSSEEETPDKVSSGRERALIQAALRPRAVERREAEGQKVLHSPTKPQRLQQQDSGASRPPRGPRRHSAGQSLGPRPWGSRQVNQAESKVLHSSLQAMDYTSSPRKPPPRPPLPAAAGSTGSAAGQKQGSHSQQGVLFRHPPAAQSRARGGQTQNQTTYLKPQTSFLHTHSNLQPQPHPQSQHQTVSAEEAQGQEDGKVPFSLTFSRLYNLKGLKDRMSKLPVQSKRGSTSSPARGHKSTS